ncbi:MAG: hypothetical protein LRZ93_02885 [Clostridiales bacterium]|nr:hypothetical protein [Clostridiales bacterium]
MELARKECYKLDIQLQPQKQKKNNNKKSKENSYRLQKSMLVSCIALTFLMSITLLFRYSSIIEARHQVYSLRNQLELLTNQKRMLNIDLERAVTSEWIEQEAIKRLDMNYPTVEKTHFFAVDQVRLAELKKQIESENRIELVKQPKGKASLLARFFSSVLGLLGNTDS